MTPRRRVVLSALAIGILWTATIVAPAAAQFVDAARQGLDFSTGTYERDPGQFGMGGLTYVGYDPHGAITLWDFAHNPVGILEADTSSTMDLYPGTGALSGFHDIPGVTATKEREDQAAREALLGYEVWRRTPGRTAYGAYGSLVSLRTDQPFSDGLERRSIYGQPSAVPVITGRLPYVKSTRWLYAARLIYVGESARNEYRQVVTNSAGQYIDQDGTLVDPTEFYTPTDYTVRTTGAGLGIGYDRGRVLKVAAGVDGTSSDIHGTLDAPRHSSQRNEKRPYTNGQLSAIGHVGRDITWGVDGNAWRSKSQQDWVFSVSAGIGANPLEGRGKLLSREERGTSLNSRVLWSHGALQVGAGLSTRYSRTDITPPDIGDPTSFNLFLDQVSYRLGADTLAVPDSVVLNETQQRRWEAGGGLTWRLLRERGTWGLEYHYRKSTIDQWVGGHGPVGVGWDLRTGLEFVCTPVMKGRVGYIYQRTDLDNQTRQNEYVGNAVTLGLGIRPTGTSWAVDAGYVAEWSQADFGDPSAPRSNRQQLSTRIQWVF